MRLQFLTAALAISTGFLSTQATAITLTPELQIQAGPLASLPVAGGSLSVEGLTAEGLPLVGTADQPILELNRFATNSPFDQIELTEFNLGSWSAVGSLASQISGTLPPLSSVSWSTTQSNQYAVWHRGNADVWKFQRPH